MNVYLKKTGYFLLALLITANSLASDPHTMTGRYLSIANKPSSEQQDLLSQTIQVRFPQSVQTIGDAMNYLLRYSGYSLVLEARQSDALKTTLKKPLPFVDREFQVVPLREALATLAGPAFTLVQDDLNREVDFHIKPSFVKKTPQKIHQKIHQGT